MSNLNSWGVIRVALFALYLVAWIVGIVLAAIGHEWAGWLAISPMFLLVSYPIGIILSIAVFLLGRLAAYLYDPQNGGARYDQWWERKVSSSWPL